MKYQSSNTKIVYDLTFDKPGRYKCPECSYNSKRKNPKDLQYYEDTGRAFCHKCNTTLFEYKPYETKKEYVVPEWKNETKLTDKAVKYWTGRMISQDTLNKMKVYSDTEWMPQFQKEVEVICFPYFRDNVLVNIKYRGAKKTFKLVSNAELIWYNFDVLKENKEIIICEGEGEVLTWIENGFENVISVPNGAGNVEYLDNSIRLFDDIETVYIANDNDEKGIELRDELARRIGLEKCKTISFKECKDGNEYFVKHGGIEFKKLIENAKPVPIDGIVKIEQIEPEIIDLFENGLQPGKEIGNELIDKYCTWELGRLAICTGVPGSGKSEAVDYITTRLNLLHGWKVAYYTPENYPLQFHYAKLHEKFSGKKFDKQHDPNFYGTYEYVKDNFYYILNEEDHSVDTVLDNAKMLVKNYGVKIVVIDPYNKLEHQYDKNSSETQYISKFLDKLTTFSKMNKVLVFLVAHPRKLQKGEVPTLYDIAGSANFYNKTDYGFTVHRERDENNMMNNEVQIYWQKIKFKHLGEQGVSDLRYNYNNGRFENRNTDINGWDNSNWLYKEKQEAISDEYKYMEPIDKEVPF